MVIKTNKDMHTPALLLSCKYCCSLWASATDKYLQIKVQPQFQNVESLENETNKQTNANLI